MSTTIKDGQIIPAPTDADAPTSNNAEDIKRGVDWAVVRANDKGRETPLPIIRNTQALLDAYGVRCRYNVMRHDMELSGDIFRGLSDDKLDTRATLLMDYAIIEGYNISQIRFLNHLAAIADLNAYSPVADFMDEAYDWYKKGVAAGRIHTSDKIGDPKNPVHIFISKSFDMVQDKIAADPLLPEEMFIRWMIGAAVIFKNDGTEAAQGVLTLVGPQGIGKSRITQAMLPEPSWATDGVVLKPGEKDSQLEVMKYAIVEIGEVDATMQRDQAALKGYLTKRKDNIRKPYGRRVETVPRNTVFLGSVNKPDFLKDETGDRRFWAIPISRVHVPHFNRDAYLLLWGYVMHLWRDVGVKWYFDYDGNQRVIQYNGQLFRNITNEEQLITDTYDWSAPLDSWTERKASTITNDIGLKRDRVRQVGRVLKVMAMYNPSIQITEGRSRQVWYLLPPLANDAPRPEPQFSAKQKADAVKTFDKNQKRNPAKEADARMASLLQMAEDQAHAEAKQRFDDNLRKA